MASFDENGRKFTPTKKAYKNEGFINSSQARNIRIMCEYEETLLRLKENKIKASVLFFGSARAKDREGWEKAVAKAEEELAAATDDESRKAAEKNLKKWKKCEWMGESAEKVAKLAELVTAWAVSRRCVLGREHSFNGVTRYHQLRKSSMDTEPQVDLQSGPGRNQHLVVCTGGGPGFMEAANKGASRVEGARNMGMGITLPFEEGLNEYVTEELAFEFHYFFTRKFWMLYHCQALVVAPGGFGTLDELFEVLTLKQTGKVQKTLPVILFGKDYWEKIINWQALVEFGTIAQEDVDSLFFTDDPQEALAYLVGCLSESGIKGNEEL
ncbi:unnamed protein product [Ectocarpus sp. 12 AP-2014]